MLPTFGEIYIVRGDICDPRDKKYNRRAVIVGVPVDVNGRIRLVTRTTVLTRRGVSSPMNPKFGFDREGVWGHYVSVDARLWVPPDVAYVDVLDPATIADIVKFFGLRGTVS